MVLFREEAASPGGPVRGSYGSPRTGAGAYAFMVSIPGRAVESFPAEIASELQL